MSGHAMKQVPAYQYTFDDQVNLSDVKESLFLATMAAESLHGRSQVHLDASFRLNEEDRTCVVDASTEVGRDIARIFTGYVTREFGEKAFHIERHYRELSAEETDEVAGAVADVLVNLLKSGTQPEGEGPEGVPE